jgi:hypothetical protein
MEIFSRVKHPILRRELPLFPRQEIDNLVVAGKLEE